MTETPEIPSEHLGKDILVSLMAGEALAARSYPVRNMFRILVPDTGPESVVRDNEGKILGVKRLIKMNN